MHARLCMQIHARRDSARISGAAGCVCCMARLRSWDNSYRTHVVVCMCSVLFRRKMFVVSASRHSVVVQVEVHARDGALTLFSLLYTCIEMCGYWGRGARQAACWTFGSSVRLSRVAALPTAGSRTRWGSSKLFSLKGRPSCWNAEW